MNRDKNIVWTGVGLAALLFAPLGTSAAAGEEVVPINVVFTLEDVVAPPGGSATVPFLIHSDVLGSRTGVGPHMGKP